MTTITQILILLT